MELLSTALNAQRHGPNGAQNRTSENGESTFQPFGEDGFTFGDLLDIINPLQHIPIISTIYRHITGDEIAALPRMIGGGLFGGLAGLGAATVNMIFDEASGKDLGEHIYTAFLGDGEEGEASGTLIAEAADPDAPWYTAGKVTYRRAVADGTELAQAPPSSPTDVASPPVIANEMVNSAPAEGLPGDKPGGEPGDKPGGKIEQVAAFAPDLSGPRVSINNLPWLDGTQTAQAAPLDPVTVTALADAAKTPAAIQPPPTIRNIRPVGASAAPRSAATPATVMASEAPDATTLDFTNSMMDGLNKYRAMAIAKNDRMPVILDIVR